MTEDARPAARPREAVIGDGISWVSRWTLRWVVIAVGAVVVGWLVSQVWSILLPILLAMILTTVLQPPAKMIERRLGCPPTVAAFAVIVGALLIVAAAVFVIAPSVGSQVVEIADDASDGLAEIQKWLRTSDVPITQDQIDSVVSAAQDKLQASATTIATGVLVGVGAITNALITAVLTLVLAFFFLKDGDRFLPWVRSLTGPRVGAHLSEVASRSWQTLGGFVRTQALVGLIDAVLIGAGLVIVGVPLALPLAVLTFVAAFAPVVGAVTVGVLAVLVALVANGWVAAVIIAIVVLVVQQLEGNLFLPWLQGKSLNLHAGVVLLTVVLGSTLFGVAGAFLGVPLVAVLAGVFRYLNDQVREASGERDPEAHGQTAVAADAEPVPE